MQVGGNPVYDTATRQVEPSHATQWMAIWRLHRGLCLLRLMVTRILFNSSSENRSWKTLQFEAMGCRVTVVLDRNMQTSTGKQTRLFAWLRFRQDRRLTQGGRSAGQVDSLLNHGRHAEQVGTGDWHSLLTSILYSVCLNVNATESPNYIQSKEKKKDKV